MIVTCLLSWLFLKRKYYRHHLTGLLIILIGLTLVALVSVVYSKGDETPTSVIGLILYLLGMTFQSCQCVLEEYVFNKYQSVHPIKLVGFEGLAGVCYYLLVLPML